MGLKELYLVFTGSKLVSGLYLELKKTGVRE